MSHKKISNLKNTDVISSSELGQFNYCSISWYLQKIGYEPKSQKINIGKNEHIKVGRIIEETQQKIKKIKIYAKVGYILLFLGIIIFIFGVIL